MRVRRACVGTVAGQSPGNGVSSQQHQSFFHKPNKDSDLRSITMRLKLRFLSWNAAAYAFLVLSPLATYAQEAPAPETHGIVVANMDRSVKPGDDFYHYANGDWINRTELPPDLGYIDPHGGNFDDFTNDLTRKRTAGLIEEAAKANAPAGSNTRKIADFYHSYMDETTIEANGVAPLRPHLDAVAAIRDRHDLARVLGESLRADVDALNGGYFHTPNLFGLWVAPGFNDPEHYTAYLLQGGLEMPDREYYLSDSESMRDIRTKYQAHVSALLKLAGFTEAEHPRPAHRRTGARHRRKTYRLGG